MKKILHVLITIVLATFSISIYSHEDACHHNVAHSESPCEGKHCNGTVGCDCSGFAPITNGEVWQQAYCRKCGHKKSVHR